MRWSVKYIDEKNETPHTVCFWFHSSKIFLTLSLVQHHASLRGSSLPCCYVCRVIYCHWFIVFVVIFSLHLCFRGRITPCLRYALHFLGMTNRIMDDLWSGHSSRWFLPPPHQLFRSPNISPMSSFRGYIHPMIDRLVRKDLFYIVDCIPVVFPLSLVVGILSWQCIRLPSVSIQSSSANAGSSSGNNNNSGSPSLQTCRSAVRDFKLHR